VERDRTEPAAAANPAKLDAKQRQGGELLAPLKDYLVRDVRSMLWMLFGAVGFRPTIS
jgi:hypothetical protein